MQRHAGITALDGNLIYPAPRQCRKNLFVLAPLIPQRCLPIEIGLDAITVADVHCGGAAEPGGGAVQSLDAPLADLAHVDVEGWLVELNDLDGICLEGARFCIEQVRKSHRHSDAIAVMSIRNGVHDGHWPRQREFELVARV